MMASSQSAESIKNDLYSCGSVHSSLICSRMVARSALDQSSLANPYLSADLSTSPSSGLVKDAQRVVFPLFGLPTKTALSPRLTRSVVMRPDSFVFSWLIVPPRLLDRYRYIRRAFVTSADVQIRVTRQSLVFAPLGPVLCERSDFFGSLISVISFILLPENRVDYHRSRQCRLALSANM